MRIIIKQIIFACGFLLTGNYLSAQQTDSVTSENLSINEVKLIKDQQQKQIDSLVKIQLEAQLRDAIGDKSKTRELEAKLREIAVNDSLRSIQQAAEIKKLKVDAKAYPVILNHDTLFNIFTRTGSFSARERALAITKKINSLYDDAFYSPDSLKIKSATDNFDIIYKNQEIIMTVSNLDGLWFGKTNAELAQSYLQTIKQTVQRERESHSLINWAKRIGLAVLILLLLIFMVALINWAFRQSKKYIMYRTQKIKAGLKLGTVKVIPAQDLALIFLKINSALRLIVTLLLIYLSLPLLFSVFPETESWTSTLLNWILGPLKVALNGIVAYLPNLFTILVIYLIFKFSLKAVRYFFKEVKRGNIQINGFHPEWSVPTFNIIRFILYAFMLVIVFPYLPGSGSAAFQGVSVFLGILISLGSSSAITNIVAGLVITYMRPFRIGDRVKIGEVTGDIIEKTMLVTRIRTIKNEDVTVPNSMVLSSSTVNYSSQAKTSGLIVHYEVTLGYDVPWKKAYEILISAALKSDFILQEPRPFVLQTRLNDFYVSYQINAYTDQAGKQALIYSSLLEHIQDELNAAGIEMLSPSYNVIRKE
ncbi:mechanosensitive ion channel family protein [Pedobacter agri]|uniref:mechanosensitive ion channel family protein n=1 Tax=Pedobacter agri TaxID=454586 RepID=UPI00278729C5|nr:mechanosensitive ion channel family protein [Pedobacter agri]MDQ1143009.1 small-conductance mechanosensitive channel [Pedobacter agri]